MSEPRGGRPTPFVVSVVGLKDSGKTTVCEALIAELASTGRRVAAVKSSHLQELDRGRAGSDSERLARAGARYVAARARGETAEWHPRRLGPAELLRRIPADIDVLLVEGGEAEFAAQAAVVCLREAEAYAETISVRRVPEERVAALSGLLAARRRAAGGPAGGEEGSVPGAPPVPVLDARLPQDAARLAQLILARMPAG